MENFVILIFGTLVLFVMAFMLITFSVLYQRKIYRAEKKKQDLENILKASELDFLEKTSMALEKERKEIAEELHHHLGSVLALQKLAIQKLAENERALPEQLPILQDQINELIAETKKISNSLFAQSRFGALDEMLINLCLTVNNTGMLTTSYQLDPCHEINASLKRATFRLVQEMFSNTLKYAQATLVELTVTDLGNGQINLLYQDNGRGFDTSRHMEGMGMRSMRQTAENFNGEFEIESIPQKGTTISITLHG